MSEETPAYKNQSLPVKKRAADLVRRLTLQEKIQQLSAEAPAIDRLGVPAYSWGGECLHGLVHTGRATVFPQSIALAATWDHELVRRIADAIASEARAKYHSEVWQNPRVGITFWTPNINLVRDPRWGRGQETYGEDPYLTGTLGAAFVRGLQGDHPRYLKASACAKHFAVHSGPEKGRSSFNAVVSPRDLHETYLPAFRSLVDAGVASVMATYNRVNGEPCCASPWLLQELLRDRWGFEGFVTSDAGAIDAIHRGHKVTEEPVQSAALAMNSGCDMEIGRPGCYLQHLQEAVQQGLVPEENIDRAVERILLVRFRLGMFDDPERVPYTDIGCEVIQCDEHIALTREAAARSCVLLKNNGVLPLGHDPKTVLVTGPNAVDQDVLLGNFYRGVSARLVTMLEGVVGAAPEGTAVTAMTGCLLKHKPDQPSNWAYGLADWADVAIAVIGISPLMEGEEGECVASQTGGDRDRLELPANQVDFVRGLREHTENLVLVVTGGSPVAMPELHELADAVLFVWYPGEQGGAAVGDLLFGHVNPSGRLPVTFPMSTEDLPPFKDYSMQGRTYRYMDAEPLYPFGFGLSYTRFEYGDLELSTQRVERGETVTASVELSNVGERAAEEVVQLYLSAEDAPYPTPRCALKAFRRVRLEPGQSEKVCFEITPPMMELVNKAGERVLEAGQRTVHIGGTAPLPRSRALGAPQPARARLILA